MSFSGFAATIVLTRTLGQSRYGTYIVVLSVLGWVAMATQFGIPMAIRKRVSEDSESNYVLSGLVVQFAMYLVVIICLWLAQPYLNRFMRIDATGVLILMLAVRIGVVLIRAILEGQHLVHVSSLLSPVEWLSRSVVQVALVVSGFGIAGAFAGYIVGAFVATVIGTYFISIPKTQPSRKSILQLKEYAQFSWLGSIKGRTFMSMDTIILAIFVSNNFIAVYKIAWDLAGIFAIFGGSIRRTLFPEISSISSKTASQEKIAGMLRVSLAYSGLIIIPGLIGATLVGDVILTIYGSKFETGYFILLILTFARLLHGYMAQFVSVIDAIDRPDLTFYIHAVFVGVNIILNVGLTWIFGWYGAAAATAISSGLGLLLGYYYASQITDVVVPLDEIGKQWVAAGVMAAIVLAGRTFIGSSLSVVMLLVGVGASVYFGTLLVISQELRTTVNDNLPFSVPVLKYM